MDRKKALEILELKADADLTAIRKAYKKQALKWHPDKNPNNQKEAEEKFKEINAAYKVLESHNKKAEIRKNLGIIMITTIFIILLYIAVRRIKNFFWTK